MKMWWAKNRKMRREIVAALDLWEYQNPYIYFESILDLDYLAEQIWAITEGLA